jgi:hypothetical protein
MLIVVFFSGKDRFPAPQKDMVFRHFAVLGWRSSEKVGQLLSTAMAGFSLDVEGNSPMLSLRFNCNQEWGVPPAGKNCGSWSLLDLHAGVDPSTSKTSLLWDTATIARSAANACLMAARAVGSFMRFSNSLAFRCRTSSNISPDYRSRPSAAQNQALLKAIERTENLIQKFKINVAGD